MEILDFFHDQDAWERNELFYPLRRFFGPYENNPYDGKSNVEIKRDFLKAIHADRTPEFDSERIENLKTALEIESVRFENDFGILLPEKFKVLLFPMAATWDFVMKHLGGTWGVTFPNCVVLVAHPKGDLSMLRRTLHHESNHSIRLNFIKDDHCYLDRVILEGLAEVYVDEKFPDHPPSKYVCVNDETTIQEWIPKLEEFWLNEAVLFNEYKDYVYGSEERKIPRWLGYGVGYYLVKAARKHRYADTSWTDLIQMPSAAFI